MTAVAPGRTPASDYEDIRVREGKRSGLTLAIAVHRTVEGRSLGGCRFEPYLSAEDALYDVKRLARAMTFKAAVAGLRLGGGKGVIAAEPDSPPDAYHRRLALRDFAELVESFEGRYITAQDAGTSEDDIAYMARFTDHLAGRPRADGGSGDPSPYTAHGVEVAIRASLRRPLSESHVIVIGLGHVGSELASRLHGAGAELTVADIDPHKQELAEALGARWLEPHQAMVAHADVLAPCALGGILDPDTVAQLNVSVVAGAANNQLRERRRSRRPAGARDRVGARLRGQRRRPDRGRRRAPRLRRRTSGARDRGDRRHAPGDLRSRGSGGHEHVDRRPGAGGRALWRDEMSTTTEALRAQQTNDFMPLHGIDHVELWVGNAKQASYYFQHAFGFTEVAYSGLETGVRDRTSQVLAQGEILLVLTGTLHSDTEVARHHLRHGDGVKVIALSVPDVDKAYSEATSRGATGVAEPRDLSDEQGRVRIADVAAYGETIHRFVDRSAYEGVFLPGFAAVSHKGRPRAALVDGIDHIVGNVELGAMEEWVRYYERVFGMTEMIHFTDEAISTEYSALMSKVVTNGDGRVKFPINEPAEGKKKSQIDEYLEFYEGAGAQHIALTTTDIVKTVEELRERGIRFLNTPETYYEDVPERIGEINERLEDLSRLGILVDRDDEGYLLQIFSAPLGDRPTIFFEIIERHGARGFGEGNFKALFEAIEREQDLRGNL